jgi:hypothetical protein
MGAWRRLPGPAVEAGALVISELATNAVLHSGGDSMITVMGVAPRALYVAVIDQGRDLSSVAPRQAAEEAESGRGLALVVAYSTVWGVVPYAGALMTWARIPVPDRGRPGTLAAVPDPREAR